MKQISIVVPTLNEQGNITNLVQRIDAAMRISGIDYEVIVIDDHSTDSTVTETVTLSHTFPVHVFLKQGSPGKAYSLLEGFTKAKHPLIAMIDADLQYPPEAIPAMIEQINEGADIVVGERTNRQVSFVRKIFSHSFRYIFGKALHHLDIDVQSGLKVFKKEIIERIEISPSKWTFDLEFLLKAKYAGYVIRDVPIDFADRVQGEAKVNLAKTSWEIGKNALSLKLKPHATIPFHSNHKFFGSGFHYRGKEYVPHNTLHPEKTALVSFTVSQKVFFTLVGILLVVGLVFFTHLTILISLSIITTIYFIDLIYNIVLMLRGFRSVDEINVNEQQLSQIADADLPIYTILCPLYKEASVLPQFVDAINRINYPKEKLQVMLLLEEDDKETQSAAKQINLPRHIEVVTVPYSQPKTKPKACNYGLKLARGKYAVIYDAEDMPDPDQLKKVVYAFEYGNKTVGCIQAKLSFYNPQHNVLTRMFTAEYALWFDLTLIGLQSTNAPIPLGGTSNHFPVSVLKQVAGWDAFNVTEDCELGIRLAKTGYTTSIINSTTLEEANSQLGNWFNQRTRWIKGYIQTYFVHNRSSNNQDTVISLRNKLAFHFTVGGKVLCLLANPIMWAISITYFLFRSTLGPSIESLFTPPVFYMGIAAMVIGNFMYFYSYMIACAKRGRYDLIKFMFLIPLYWLFMSAAAWVSVYRLIKAPHHWSKTLHGLHLKNNVASNHNYLPNLKPNYATN